MEIVTALDVKEDLKSEDQFIMCRICVEPICEGVPHHLHDEMHEGLLLAHIYKVVTNIMLNDDTGIPGDICDSCFKKLIDCYRFIEECVKANKIFLSLRRQFALCNKATNNLKDLSCLHSEVSIKDDQQEDVRNESSDSQILGSTQETNSEYYKNPSTLSDQHYETVSKVSNSSSEKFTAQVETTKNVFNKTSLSTTSRYSSPMKSEWFKQQNMSQQCGLKQSVVVRQEVRHFSTRTFSKSYKNITNNKNASNILMDQAVKDMESVEADGIINQCEEDIEGVREQSLDNQLNKNINSQKNENANTVKNQLENEVEKESKEINERTNPDYNDISIKIKELISEDNDANAIYVNNSSKDVEDNEEIKEKNNVLINASNIIKNNSNNSISLAIEEKVEESKLDTSSENNSQSQVIPALTPKVKEKCINSNFDLLKQNESLFKEILQENHNMKSLNKKEGYLIIKRTDSKTKGVSPSDRGIKKRYSMENKGKGKLISNDNDKEIIPSKTTNDFSKNNETILYHTPVVTKKDKIIIHSNISINNKGTKKDVGRTNLTNITTEIINGKQNEEVIPLKINNTEQNDDSHEFNTNKNKCVANRLIEANNLGNNDQFQNTANSLVLIDKEIDKFYEELPHDIISFNRETKHNIDFKSSSSIINMGEITLNLSSNSVTSSNSNNLVLQNQSKQVGSETPLQNQNITVEDYECGNKINKHFNEANSLNFDNSQNKSPNCKTFHTKYGKFWKSQLTRKNKSQSSKDLNKISSISGCDNRKNNFDGQVTNTSQNNECSLDNLITIDENSAPILDQVNAILQRQNTSQRSEDLEDVTFTNKNQLLNNTLDSSMATEIEPKEDNAESLVQLDFVDDKDEILIDFNYDNNQGILNLNVKQDETNFNKHFVGNLETSKDTNINNENCCNVNYLPLIVENYNSNKVELISEKPKNVIATGDFIPLIDLTEEENCNKACFIKPQSSKKRKARKQSPTKEHIPLFVIDKEPQRIELNDNLDIMQKKKRKSLHKQTKNKVVTNYDHNRLFDQDLPQENCLVDASTKATSLDLSNCISTNESILIEDNESEASDKSEGNLSIRELANQSEPYSCECCDKTNKKTPDRVACKICSESFFTLTALKRHLFLKHREPNSYKCAWCAKEYIQWLCFEQHVTREHRATNKCASCKLYFTKKSQMKLHNKKFHK